eukprot:CAMPEP_0117685224 /NCGR_PEP_ID=MMETSP0804-20121206/21609_1 /TAXON_ID=1074897 /ORGANISM="Tetraselmis astigmatica, Strain CCMP880" /LENGTH=104 /DNA_ID=CAMNT_0005496449 /DNA_START=259 /DNA_END=569 /DNA_ORIENTATION=+
MQRNQPALHVATRAAASSQAGRACGCALWMQPWLMSLFQDCLAAGENRLRPSLSLPLPTAGPTPASPLPGTRVPSQPISPLPQAPALDRAIQAQQQGLQVPPPA